MRRISPLAAAAAVALVGLSGCVPATESESGYLLLVAPGVPETQLLATLDGELALSGNCFALASGGAAVPVVFATGAQVADGDRIDVPGIGSVGLGDELHGGGGEVPVDASPVPVPDTCDADSVIIFTAL